MLTLKVGLFLSEWHLPEKNGLTFCRELRREKQYQTTPFLLMSTESFRKDVILASEGGVDGYLLKPFSFEEFRSQLTQIIQSIKNPSPFVSMMERVESHLELGEAWVAESLLREALTMKPHSARAMTALGRVQLLNKNAKEAAESFKRAVEFNPDYVDGYKYLLQISEEQKDLESVIQTATVLHGLSPENPRYPLLLAKAQMEYGDLEGSERMFKMAVRLSPTLAEAYRGLGMLYLQKKEFEKATRSLERALDLEKGDIATLNSLGLSYVKQGLIEEGIKRYRLALAIDAFDARVLFNLGLACREIGDTQGARDAFQRAIAVDPEHAKAKRQLALIAKRDLDLLESRPVVKKAS